MRAEFQGKLKLRADVALSWVGIWISKELLLMAITSLLLPPNVLFKGEQRLEFEKIATFIGGNGSGKSTILKSIFDEKLKGDLYEDFRIVCFSSGQNESYSRHFSEYLNVERSKRNALNLDCFYYDKLWSKLLIFLATTSAHDGLVRDFLKQNNYLIENNFDEDETTKLSFKVKVDKSYTNLVKQSLEDEASGETDVITNKAYHRTLQNFINSLVSDEYKFERPLDQVNIELTQEILSKISFETDQNEFFESKVLFFTQAADNDFFILKDSFDLKFSRAGIDLSLEDLSDGEYQLLFLYALIDIFDSKETLFLLDEADSHLHYKNIDRLWDVFFKITGRILTTTHLLDSINKSEVGRLKVVENGEVKQATLARLQDRLLDLAKLNDPYFLALSFFENIVLIDADSDWEQFKLLLTRKLLNDNSTDAIDKLSNNFIAIPICSGFNGMKNEIFAGKKILWLKNFVNHLNRQAHKTRNVFLICDRDELPLSNIGTEKCDLLLKNDSCVNIATNLKYHILSWTRREIKHYLLSYTALADDIVNVTQELDLGAKSELRPGSSGDVTTDGKRNIQLAGLNSKLVKKIVDPYINIDGKGFCVDKAREYVNRMPPEEISEDIVKMYEYLVTAND